MCLGVANGVREGGLIHLRVHRSEERLSIRIGVEDVVFAGCARSFVIVSSQSCVRWRNEARALSCWESHLSVARV